MAHPQELTTHQNQSSKKLLKAEPKQQNAIRKYENNNKKRSDKVDVRKLGRMEFSVAIKFGKFATTKQHRF